MSMLEAIFAANRAGVPRGIPSWCTAHPETLRAVLRHHAQGEGPVLIEATCNQVNQHGGYTGMAPARFRAFAEDLAGSCGVDPRRIVLGGDHLGPNPWRHLPAAQAMAEARIMVKAYVEAGFSKIHLDASMACADDSRLDEREMARRAAELCAAAEAALVADPPRYVIGTEVPVPGGETQVLDALAVTRPEAVAAMWEAHRAAFAERGLEPAFARVVGIVVQPGVDFGDRQLFVYDRAAAAALSASLAHYRGAVFEAHSTDYQPLAALSELVRSHFAILKVGPELTFAYRRAIFALAAIEEELRPAAPSRIAEAIAAAMDADPRHWRSHVAAGPGQRLARLYSLSDRMRYYWPDAGIQAALKALAANIDGADIPSGLLLQYAGAVPDGAPPLSARVVDAHVGAVAQRYRSACGG